MHNNVNLGSLANMPITSGGKEKSVIGVARLSIFPKAGDLTCSNTMTISSTLFEEDC